MATEIILHRGYKGKFPENSRISFEEAMKENLAFETDIRISKDEGIYLVHDNIFEKFEEPNQRLCSLEEVCELARQINYKNFIFIHIKEERDIGKVVEFLENKNYNFKEIVRFFATDEITLNLVKKIKKDYSKYKVGLHFNDNSKINEEEFKLADFIWADEINKRNITKELVDFSHKIGKPLYAISPELIAESVFNKDIEGRWKELRGLNVDGICTDLPEEFLSFLKKN